MIQSGMLLNHRYQILDLIGSGGMAQVYRATNVLSKKTVAIKILKDEFANDADFLRRFEREAKATLHLSHKNIVSAYDIGEYEGIPYIVLEYIEGQTLKEIITENGPMPPRLAVALTVQVLNALAAAHAAGIIHRDIKPQNVIITPAGRAMLTDFGIARDVTATTKTFAGDTIIGSVHYLSPEQAKGKPATEASDLYSVGVMLYELVTGHVPFDSDNTVAIALMHLSKDPVPPMEENPKVSQALNDVILRAMSRDITRRYATAAEMSAHLRRTLAEPNGDFARVYDPKPVQPQTEKKKKRKKRYMLPLLVGIASFALIVGIGTLFILFQLSKDSEAKNLPAVPTLINLSVEIAEQTTKNSGLDFHVSNFMSSDSVPKGYIIMQSPDAGVPVDPGTDIFVTVSTGSEEDVTVPDVVGKPFEEAEAALASLNIPVGQVTKCISDVAVGLVDEQYPAPGTPVTDGISVDLFISAPSDEIPIIMPNVTEDVLNLSLMTLRNLGLTDITVRYDPESRLEDEVILSQFPEPSSKVMPDTPIQLVVSGTQVYDDAASVVLSVDVPEVGAPVVCSIDDSFDGIPFTRIVHEAAAQESGKLKLSLTVYDEEERSCALTVRVNGTIQKTVTLHLTSEITK